MPMMIRMVEAMMLDMMVRQGEDSDYDGMTTMMMAMMNR